MEFFKDLVTCCPVRDIQVIRTIEDGNYVFVHVFQYINNGHRKWITADLFDTDANDKLIEHWDNIEIIPPRGKWANSGKF